MSFHKILSLLAACTVHQPNTSEPMLDHSCAVTQTGTTTATDPGPVGLSAVDAAALLDGRTLTATFERVDIVANQVLPTTTFTTEVTLSLALAGDPILQDRVPAAPESADRCADGPAMQVPVLAGASSPDFTSVEPHVGYQRMTWLGPDLADVRLEIGLVTDPADWLDGEAGLFDCTAGGLYPPEPGRTVVFGTGWGEQSEVQLDLALMCDRGPAAAIYWAETSWE